MDNEALQFPSGVKVRQDRLWILTSRLQNFIVGNVTEDEKSYRILSAPIDKLTRGTKCESQTTAENLTTQQIRPSSSSGYASTITFTRARGSYA
ncbi:hypothetical protein O3M35_002306 [Rhynocoris fuscipes]|uniref:Uncharacterized protein n=1 Tax=Rhynocoris fuscipes TaxID=488301 RepID=A0AAW1CNX4_9HEMI